MKESFNDKRILVIVAHPDDELLGPGATINKLIRNHNCNIKAVILGEGITSRADKREPGKFQNELKIHQQNILKSQEIIGYESVSIYDLPDNRFDSIPMLDIVKIIEKEKNNFKPEIIFTHHGGDLNIDHRLTFNSVITATRPLESECVKTIITFETPSSTEWQAFNHPNPFLPNLFFHVSEENLYAKINAMDCYEFEKRPFPHPRSSENLKILARRYGAVIGTSYAEAFMLIRSIIQ